MSRTPYLLEKARNGYRMGNGELIDAMINDGLWDVYGNKHMGVYGDQCAVKCKLTKEDQDSFAVRSFTRARKAIADGGKQLCYIGDLAHHPVLLLEKPLTQFAYDRGAPLGRSQDRHRARRQGGEQEQQRQGTPVAAGAQLGQRQHGHERAAGHRHGAEQAARPAAEQLYAPARCTADRAGGPIGDYRRAVHCP